MRACAILLEIDGVVALDVLRAHDAGDDQFSDFVIDADLLLAFDHEIAVRRIWVTTAATLVCRFSCRTTEPLPSKFEAESVCKQPPAGSWFACVIVLAPMKSVIPESSLEVRAALAFVGDVGLVGEIHGHGQEVADPGRALVLEERSGAVCATANWRYRTRFPVFGIGICTGL